MIRVLILCYFFCCLFGCENEDGFDSELPRIINPTTSYSTFDILDYVESLEYIPLEENEKNLLNEIKKIIKLDDIYIVKCWRSSALFFFDSKGVFLKKVIATGEGPYEFSNLMDVAYDKNNQRLFLLDFYQKKVVIYDLAGDGKIEEGIKLDQHAYTLEHYKSKLYMVSQNSELKKIKIYSDSTFDLIGEGVSTRQEGFNKVKTQGNMKEFADTLFINIGFTDTIYYSVGNELKPYAILGEGRTSMTSIADRMDLFDRSTHPEVEELTNSNERKVIVPVGSFSIYKNIWFINLVWRGQVIIWNKNKNTQRYLDFNEVENRSLISYYWLFHFLDVDNEGFIYNSIQLNADFYADAKRVVNSNKYDQHLINSINDLLEKYPEGSLYENPVIVKVKFYDALFN